MIQYRPALDSRQKAALRTLRPCWEPVAVLASRTSLYRPAGLSIVLGQFAVGGLAERRGDGRKGVATEWRITEAGLEARGPVAVEGTS